MEIQNQIQLDVLEDLLARLERFRTTLRTTKISKQRTIEAFSISCADLNNFLKKQSSLTNRPSQISHPTTSTTTTKQQIQPGPSSDNQESQELRVVLVQK